jgi:hypothetical protein
MNTSRRGSTCRVSSRQASRRSRTSGRSCSAARSDFFEHEPELAEPLADRLHAHAQAQRRLDLLARGVGVGGEVRTDPLPEVGRQLGLASRASRQRLERAALAQSLHPARAGAADAEQVGDLLGRLVLGVQLDDPLADQCRVSLHAARPPV